MMRLGRAGRELLRWGRGGSPGAAPRRGAEVLVGAAGGESSGEWRPRPGVRGAGVRPPRPLNAGSEGSVGLRGCRSRF